MAHGVNTSDLLSTLVSNLNVESPLMLESPILESTLQGLESTLSVNTLPESSLLVTNASILGIEIVEQPASNDHRFRYRSEQPDKQKEGKAVGSLYGENSTAPYKTYPTIKVTGYQGSAIVFVSCVEEKEPFRAHPNNLIGKNCTKGICKVKVSPETDMTAVFPKIGIECVKRQDISTSLEHRLQLKDFVDPFAQGFDHMNPKSYLTKVDMNSIRLCFQVFIPNNQNQYISGPKVVSNVIKDKRVHEGLKIVDISDNFAPVEGGKKIIMFTSRICKEDIQVHFAFNHGGQDQVLKGNFGTNDIHKQCALSFTTPIFPDQKITQKVQAKVHLFRPSDKAQSKAEEFYFQPNKQDEIKPTHMREKLKREKKPTKTSSQNQDTTDEPSTREQLIRPKRHPSAVDHGGTYEEIPPTFTSRVLNGKISFADIQRSLNMETPKDNFSTEETQSNVTSGSEQGS